MISKRGCRQKGHAWEREVASILRGGLPSCVSDDIRRGHQSADGAREPDVTCPGMWIECKRGKRIGLFDALTQAESAAHAKPGRDGLMPVVIAKRDRERPVAMLSLDHFVELLRTRPWPYRHSYGHRRRLLTRNGI
jgi:hypothetical protein